MFSITGQTMGTSYSVVAVDHAHELNEPQIAAAIDAALQEVNQQMSNWDPMSEISRFNARNSTEPVAISEPLAHVIAAAEEVNRASEGRFDTTMGPLIELWGFGASGAPTMPQPADIARALERSGHSRSLALADGTLRKQLPEANVYLAAIGKGFGADHVGRALASLGIRDFMVEIGGDLYATGRNADGLPWQIGIETPSARQIGVHEVIGLTGMGLASSGDYRNFFERDGARYSHVIDPTTGRPITHQTGSATVIANNAMLADAWATAMLTLGRERGLEIAEAEGLAVMFIDRNGSGTDIPFSTVTSSHYDQLTA
ncbi:MAG: FAD:protein FMN transferase [Pseudomonadota bacterium]